MRLCQNGNGSTDRHLPREKCRAVSFDTEKGIGAFEYDSSFIRTGIELSPIKMPLSQRIYSFPELNVNYSPLKRLSFQASDTSR